MRTFWQYRYLLWNLIVKDLKTRYKTAVFGFLWTFLNPLFFGIVLSFVFYHIFGGGDSHYVAYILTGIFPWNFFAQSWNQATVSITGNSYLIQKVSFPREILPLSVIGAYGFNFIISLVVLFILLLVFRTNISWGFLLLPAVIFCQAVLLVGLGFLTSALEVLYRDTKYLVEMAILFLFYLTPIIYEFKILPESVLTVARFNPMSGLIMLYRFCWGLGGAVDWMWVLLSLAEIFAVLVLGVWVFRKLKNNFADYV